jgi:hypothetical protein
MAFKFTELNVTLNVYYDKNDNNAPKAELNVQTCGGASLELQFGTCERDSKACMTKPTEMMLLNPSNADLTALQQQLKEMLERFGPAGTVVKNTPKMVAKKTARTPAKEATKTTKKKT